MSYHKPPDGYSSRVVSVLMEGSVAVPILLLKWYRRLKLTETEAMLFIHLAAFRDRELKPFPTMDEISERMTITTSDVIKLVQKLIRDGWLTIDEHMDHATGIQYESYNLLPMYARLAELLERSEEPPVHTPSGGLGSAGGSREGMTGSHAGVPSNLFMMFEKEFGRPLSPMECETISVWLDQDKYSPELIQAALKEAVFAGKVHFKYIDRILLEWSRNKVYTVDQAKEYAQRFRGMR